MPVISDDVEFLPKSCLSLGMYDTVKVINIFKKSMSRDTNEITKISDSTSRKFCLYIVIIFSLV